MPVDGPVAPAQGMAHTARQARQLSRLWRLAQAWSHVPPAWAVRGLNWSNPLAGYSQVAPHIQRADWARFVAEVAPATNPLAAWHTARQAFAAGVLQAVWARRGLKHLLAQAAGSGWQQAMHLMASGGQATAPNGALVLTVHNGLHHSLCVLLAQRLHKPVWLVAQPPESSAWWPQLAPEITAQHASLESAMGGGGFMFMRGGGTRQGVAQRLAQGDVVVSMHDTHSPSDRHALPATVLGRSYAAPAGLLQVALDAGVPVWFAAQVWQPSAQQTELVGHRLQGHSVQALLQAYALAVEGVVHSWPWAWWGWQWHASWPQASNPASWMKE